MEQYKRKFEENWVDFSGLEKHFKIYTDYEYGNPIEASKKIIEDMNKYLDEVSKNLNLAGNFLAPAMKDFLLKNLIKNIKDIRIK